jgi:hypothetical protein
MGLNGAGLRATVGWLVDDLILLILEKENQALPQRWNVCVCVCADLIFTSKQAPATVSRAIEH